MLHASLCAFLENVSSLLVTVNRSRTNVSIMLSVTIGLPKCPSMDYHVFAACYLEGVAGVWSLGPSDHISVNSSRIGLQDMVGSNA